MKHVSEWNIEMCTCMTVNGRQSDENREERRDRARVRRVVGVMTRSAQDRGGDRGGSVSDRLLMAPLWRL